MSNQRQSSNKQQPGGQQNIQQGGHSRDPSPGQQGQSGPGRDTPQQGGTSAGRDNPSPQTGQQGSKPR
ncbi:hypothetical protein [Roseateles sp.]|uniref:hypothetical protein n=1 Tax=Roseateles sp. TaxID=1971397 RepID=UPI0039EBDE6F